MFYDVGLLLIFLSICMKFYDLGAFCNNKTYAPGGDVNLPAGEENAVTLAVGEAEENPNKPQEIQEGLQKLKDEERKNIIDITNFNLTTDDVAMIALLTAFLAVINGPSGAITFGAFLAIAAGLDSKYSETAKDLLEKIPPSQNPEHASAEALKRQKEKQTAVG